MNFWKKRKFKKTIDGYAGGTVSCKQCGKGVRLNTLQPLAIFQCPKCGAADFAPMKISTLWLFQPLGGGGGGSVYKAYDTATELFCAVKLAHRDRKDDPEIIDHIDKEASILEEIGRHPNIVRFVSGGFADGEHYCAIEFLEGERLSDRVARLGRMLDGPVREMALDILSAEQQIYGKGYLYRDLKPQNIIIRPDNVHVLFDFGSCLPLSDARVPPPDRFVEGSAYYMPPERLWRSGEDQPSEIYSLGMVMYHALTGRTFFNSTQTIKELALKHVSALRLTVSADAVRSSSPAMINIINDMIKIKPEDRFQTFGAVQRALLDKK